MGAILRVEDSGFKRRKLESPLRWIGPTIHRWSPVKIHPVVVVAGLAGVEV